MKKSATLLTTSICHDFPQKQTESIKRRRKNKKNFISEYKKKKIQKRFKCLLQTYQNTRVALYNPMCTKKKHYTIKLHYVCVLNNQYYYEKNQM